VKLSVIVPVRNEKDTVLQLIERLRQVDCGMPKEIIVVDGASTDGTREALTALAYPELELILEDRPRGKGRAVRTGFERASGDILIVQDADLELDPAQIPALLAPVVDDGMPAVLGSRFLGRGRGDAPMVNYVGNVLLTRVANLLFRARLTDILTCYKVLRADVLKELELRCDGFDFDAEITCRLLRDGHRVIELPVTYEPRTADEGKKLTAGVGWSVLLAILRVRFSSGSANGRRASMPW
jgi:glycosyltransferase involved in cell wall biosynthesis